jgi:DnaA family protein
MAGACRWEQAAFHLYNRVEQCGGRLLVTARAPPLQVSFDLADLASRLSVGLTLQLRPLDDFARRSVVQQRARERGFAVPDDVAAFLLRRCRRDMHSLLGLVEKLDRCSLAEQRRITIPFVRALIDLEGWV